MQQPEHSLRGGTYPEAKAVVTVSADAVDWKLQTSQLYTGYRVVRDVFSPEECRELIALCSSYPALPGKTWNGSEYSVDKGSRQLMTAHVPRAAGTHWIYERMDAVFFDAAEFWSLDVRETLEDLKYLAYAETDHFSLWHTDIGPDYASRRKISMSIELTPSSEYEGGEIQIFPRERGHVAGADREAGTAVVFPSSLYHRVTAVSRGTRRSLVNWISGPPFR